VKTFFAGNPYGFVSPGRKFTGQADLSDWRW